MRSKIRGRKGRNECDCILTFATSPKAHSVSEGRDHLGDRGCTNPPQDHMTEAKLTRDLRNDNYMTILHSWTEM